MKNIMERSYRGLFWGLVLLGALIDQVGKYCVFQQLYNKGRGDQYHVVPGFFELWAEYTHRPVPTSSSLNALQSWSGGMLPKVNHGALFGLGGQYESLANGLFTGISIIAAIAIATWGMRPTTARDRNLSIALGLILAGTLGNLYDRIVFSGVRDFLHLHYRNVIEWPVFNPADCCLVLGALLLLAQAFTNRSTVSQTGKDKPAASNLRREVAEV